MLLAVAVAAVSSWVPMRWASGDPASLELLQGTPVNCVLLEKEHWSPAFSAKAHAQGIAALGVVRAGVDPAGARQAELDGVVLEGENTAAPPSGLAVFRLPVRTAMTFDGPLVGTAQGVWSGINQVDEGKAKAAPSGAPWIDTNAGFLRFVHALTPKPIWIANTPPAGKAFPVTRYMQLVSEAAMCGARWVVALDSNFEKRLLAREATAVRDWKKLSTVMAFIESHREWLTWHASGQLTLIQGIRGGALLSGGILDMIAVKHTPVRPVPNERITPEALRGALMTVNVNPAALTPEQKQVLSAYTKAGGTVLTSPPGWQFPEAQAGQITLDEKELVKLDEIWKEVNTLTGRRNLGARLFNVGSMLSNLTASADGKKQLLHLVNYTDFPVESITAHMLGTWKKATLHQPGKPPVTLETYPVDEGTGVDIPAMDWYAILEVE